MSAIDRHYLDMALALASQGLYSTMPNPRVGCVIVNAGQVVGRGWHQRAGQPHAE
ncbi:riboflavin biosynthesis protein RibD, partial [Pseudomonas mosselii]|nr:riboflavin biosynthesis protein RibD [Pseudomonas mosselii]